MPEEAFYRLEGGPCDGPLHWTMAHALAKTGTAVVCTNRGVGWHRYERSANPNVYVWGGLCQDDHEYEECGGR